MSVQSRCPGLEKVDEEILGEFRVQMAAKLLCVCMYSHNVEAERDGERSTVCPSQCLS